MRLNFLCRYFWSDDEFVVVTTAVTVAVAAVCVRAVDAEAVDGEILFNSVAGDLGVCTSCADN